MGRFFAGLNATAILWRNGGVGEHLVDVSNLHGGTSRKAAVVKQDRACGYISGTLTHARTCFTTATTVPVAWDSGAPSTSCS